MTSIGWNSLYQEVIVAFSMKVKRCGRIIECFILDMPPEWRGKSFIFEAKGVCLSSVDCPYLAIGLDNSRSITGTVYLKGALESLDSTPMRSSFLDHIIAKCVYDQLKDFLLDVKRAHEQGLI
jgi:hypothetical protein